MALPKVTYFDFPGSRGEEVRLALTLAGVEFEDNRIDRATFGTMRSSLPFPSVPTFEIDGHGTFAQTNAILRLIGRQHQLYPDDPYAAARHDSLMEAAEEFRNKISPTMRIADPAEKKAARQQLAQDYIPLWGAGIERLIGQGPFVGGTEPGVADLKLFMIDKWVSGGGIEDIPTDAFDAFPQFKGVAKAVAAHPAIVAWYAKAA